VAFALVERSAALVSFNRADPQHVAHEAAMNALQRRLMASSTLCRD
jgi:hypothetical protein